MNVKYVWHFSMQKVSGHSVAAGPTVMRQFSKLQRMSEFDNLPLYNPAPKGN